MPILNVFKLLLTILFYTIINLNTDKQLKNTEKTIKRNLHIIQNQEIIKEEIFLENIQTNIYNDLLATITIEKINLISKPIYKVSSNKNNIEKNITILKESVMPNNPNSIIFLLAHSGTGNIAYFKNLHKLKTNDLINIYYDNIIYTYKIETINLVEKNGYLKITKEYTNELILTTCAEDNTKQLIIKANLIKKTNS